VRPKFNSFLNPSGENLSKGNTQPASSNSMQCPHPAAPLGPNDIILANPLVMKQEKVQTAEEDPLDAINMGIEDEANMDVFLNLQNIEDVEMFVHSSKRKRNKDGEEASSRGPP